MDKEQFHLLYHAFLEDRLEAGQLSLFREYSQQQPYEGWLEEFLEDTINRQFAGPGAPDIDLSRMRSHLLQNVVGVEKKKTPVKYYYAAAASLLVLLAAAFYLWLKPAVKQQLTEQAALPATEIEPAKDIAMLTLADGSSILLDSAGLLKLSTDSTISATQDGEGSLHFRNGGVSIAGVNKLTTPRGGQFRLTLPDGSRAWLNAASSISFPTIFSGKSRPVKITGEVYLEVKQDQERPFMVEAVNTTVEVLGTSFNVNAYADDGKIVTTLLNGSIKVQAGKTVMLKPGQQAIIPTTDNTDGPQLKSNADINKVMSWKNGFFNFDNAQLPEVMKQLERWYDIDVKYDGPVPDVTFRGGMDREVQFSGIIRFLNSFGIHTKLEGQTLYISRK